MSRPARSACRRCSDRPPRRGRPPMSQTDTSEEAPAASLVGSLSVFSLSDVLSMLASTAQTGELAGGERDGRRPGVARPRRALQCPGRRPPRPSVRRYSSWPASPTAGSTSPPACCLLNGQPSGAGDVRPRPRSDLRWTSGGRSARWSPSRPWSPCLPTPRGRTSRSATTSGGC